MPAVPDPDALVTADLVELEFEAPDKDAWTRRLAERAVAAGRVTDLEGLLADVAAREALMPAALEGGVGIPHCKSAHVTTPTVVFGRSKAGVDYGASDGPAALVFLIVVPAQAGADHLRILAALARAQQTRDFKAYLSSANSPAAVGVYLNETLSQ